MENKSFKDTLLRGIALLGLILILVLGAWGIIVLAFNAPRFLTSAGSTIAGIFTDREETIEVPVVSTTESASPATSGSAASGSTAGTAPTGSAKSSVTSPKSSYTYTPAIAPVTQLYGLPDLAVRIISIVPQGNRYSMQFEISNAGTNVAATGWTFTAILPLDPIYTYNSGPQQALQPSDKIVYTLGFNLPAQANVPYTGDYYDRYYNDYRYPYNYNNYNYNYGSGVVTINVDPFGRLYESNKFNNTTSQNLSYNYNYYPTYPTYPYAY